MTDGFPPVRIGAGMPRAANVRIRGDVSSQFLTGLLQSLPLLDADVTVEVEGELISKPYVDITLNLMQRFGIAIERDGWRSFTVRGGDGLQSPGTLAVEGDASGASYFLAAGAIGGGPVRVTGVGRDSIQGDVAFRGRARVDRRRRALRKRLDRGRARRACAAARSIATRFRTRR
jgi:3-phosphoshikimate 1-carboxyvinyltransferase